ncbi:hypothetical protein BH24ACT3_BH24ACT3_05750 [soil metagenome]
MSVPHIAVVVATHNRAQLIARLVAAVAGQRDVPGTWDLVVVDDASTDGTPAELARLAPESPVPLTALRLERNAGPATARNRGWRAARGDLIAFTDDDCVPQPGWLSALSAELAHADLVQGRTVADPAGRAHRGPWSRTINADGTTGLYETCNMGYSRELLEDLGGFDQGFRHPFGEDIDLALRALDTGARAAYADDALVHHDITPSSYRRRLADVPRQAGMVRTVRNHPTFRARLHHGVFVKPTHPPALLAALGAGLAAARPTRPVNIALGVALTVPYVHRRIRAGLWGRREWPVTIPLALVADLLEIAVLARASVRHRTLVL